ncbi:MAG: sugar phosphate nucleotidyltransferase [Acidimicrobiia bacterium]
MKAVVLVGGEGTRLRPLTTTIPKPLLPIANQPFLERQLTWLASHGVDDVVLSLGYLPDAFIEQFPESEFAGVRLRYAVEDQPLGTAGAIRFAADGIDERFIVCNGDVLTDLDLSALIAFHAERGAEATISLTEVEDPTAFGVVPTFDDGEVKAFIEKPPADTAPTKWINAGTYVLEPSVLERIPPRLNVSIERETFPRMLEQRRILYAQPSPAYWLDIGTPEKYLQAHRDVLAGQLGVPVVGAVERSAGVWVQGAPRIAHDAEVVPPVLIADGAVIASGAKVANSVLGARAAVDAGAVVESSVMLADSHIASSGVARNSILGPASLLERDVVVDQITVVGPDAVVEAQTTLHGARVDAGGATS